MINYHVKLVKFILDFVMQMIITVAIELMQMIIIITVTIQMLHYFRIMVIINSVTIMFIFQILKIIVVVIK
jgi:hypothetical protein